MEHVPEILKALAEYGVSLPTLILLLMMYLMGVKSGMFPALWKKEEEEKAEETPKWAQYLVQHFNHDTTDHHTNTHKKLDILIEKEEDEVKERRDILDATIRIETKLNEFDKYGVKMRKSIKT